MKGMKESDDTKIAIINTTLQYIQRDITEIKDDIKGISNQFVARTEFEDFKRGEFANIKKIVYGAVGAILVAFMLAATSFFIKKWKKYQQLSQP